MMLMMVRINMLMVSFAANGSASVIIFVMDLKKNTHFKFFVKKTSIYIYIYIQYSNIVLKMFGVCYFSLRLLRAPPPSLKFLCRYIITISSLTMCISFRGVKKYNINTNIEKENERLNNVLYNLKKLRNQFREIKSEAIIKTERWEVSATFNKKRNRQ